jgi:hypothetical protein
LGKHKKALQTFEAFSNSHKKEYVQWIEESKTDEKKQTHGTSHRNDGRRQKQELEICGKIISITS